MLWRIKFLEVFDSFSNIGGVKDEVLPDDFHALRLLVDDEPVLVVEEAAGVGDLHLLLLLSQLSSKL